MSAIRDRIAIFHGEVARARGTENSVRAVVDGLILMFDDAIRGAIGRGASEDQLSEMRDLVAHGPLIADRSVEGVNTVPSPDGTVPAPAAQAGPFTAEPAPDHRLDPFDPSKDRPVQRADEPAEPPVDEDSTKTDQGHATSSLHEGHETA